jgi:hypothetical protein
MRMCSCRAIGLALLMTAGSSLLGLSASAAQLSPEQRVSRVTTDLAALGQEVKAARADLQHVASAAPQLPPGLSQRVAGLRPHWQAILEPLKGLPWTMVSPVVPQAQALLAEIGALEADVAAWKPAARPTPPPRSARTPTGTGAISGLVWDAATGQPMANVMVGVGGGNPVVFLSFTTDANGNYLASGLTAGTYLAEVESVPDYIAEAYDGILCGASCWPDEGTSIPVDEGATTPNIDFAMYHYSSISGTVTDAATGLPLLGTTVTLYNSNGWYFNSSQSDQSGSFTFGDLLPGTYFATAGGNGPYMLMLYDGIPCDDSSCTITNGTPITVEAGGQRNDIGFSLIRLGTISGTVTDATTGQGIGAASVAIYDSSGAYRGYGACNSDGTYTTTGLAAGSYFVRTSSHSGYVDELYDGIECGYWCDPTTGTPVSVTFGQDTPNIDFALHEFGTFSGTVLARGSGTPLSNAYVGVVDSSGTYVGNSYSDGLGQYTTSGLLQGTYFASAYDPPYLQQLFNDIPCYSNCDPTTGTPITVNLDGDTPGIDFNLDLGGSVSGHVRAASDGAPLESAGVTLYDATGGYARSGYTDGTGSYSIPGLPPGTYFAEGILWPDYASILYNGMLCDPTCTVTSGTPIAVTLANETAGIDFNLPRRGFISGTVTDAQTGLPIANAQLSFVSSQGSGQGWASTDDTGHYTSSGLTAGTYFALAWGSNWPQQYVETLYNGIPCPYGSCNPLNGTPITVTLSTETPGINFALSPYGSITGTVMESLSGSPLSGITLTLFNSSGSAWTQSYTTASDGTYAFYGLDTGTYFITTSNSSGYLNELYNNIECEPTCTPTTGTPIFITLGAATQSVDFYIHRPFFADVPRDQWARAFIEALYADGVTAGCATAPLRYCPNDWLLRQQSAVFLLVSKQGPAYQPPPATGIFDDVPTDSPFAPWIEELFRRGVTAGCSVSPPLFCPSDPFTRREAAVMLLVTKEGQGYTPPPAIGIFQDVPISDPFAPWVEELYDRGITAGCSVSPPLFCPDQTVNRAQSAVFLVTTFGLPPVR